MLNTLTFWGCRGSIATHSKDQNKYGSNTPCISIENENTTVLFDAGSGLYQYFRYEKQPKKTYYVVLSHYHWDHIIALPFLEPLYTPNNHIVIVAESPKEAEKNLELMIDGYHHPVSTKELISYPSFMNFETFKSKNILKQFNTIEMNHPSTTYGFTFSINNKSIALCSDNEIGTGIDALSKTLNQHHPQYDILIHDSQYTPEDYKTRTGWGHSTHTDVLKLGEKIQAKNIFFFHHNPLYSDQKLEGLLAESKNWINQNHAGNQCYLAQEQHTLSFVEDTIHYKPKD